MRRGGALERAAGIRKEPMILLHGNPRSGAATSLLGLALGAFALLFLTCAHQRQPTTLVGPPGAPSTPASRLTEGPDVKFWKGRSDLIRPPAPPPAVELVLPRVDRWSLKNGLQVVAVPRRGLPIVSFTVAVKAGGYDEQKGRTQGVADFVAAMLRKGAGKRGAEEIADAIDGVGGGLEAAAGMESSMVTCSVLVK
ncbi:MAG: hypothetical protein ABJA82_12430, partial [Myxococcales bacterium]